MKERNKKLMELMDEYDDDEIGELEKNQIACGRPKVPMIYRVMNMYLIPFFELRQKRKGDMNPSKGQSTGYAKTKKAKEKTMTIVLKLTMFIMHPNVQLMH